MNNTPSEKRLIYLMRFWIVSFIGTCIVILFFGDVFLGSLNTLSDQLNLGLEPIPLPHGKFWLCLAMSLMVTLIYMAYMIQKDVQKYHHFVVPFLISKVASTFFFFSFFFFYIKAYAFLASALTDGSVFLVTYFFYKSFLKEMALKS